MGKADEITDFEIAYFVEHNMRSKHADTVEKGPTHNVTHNLQTWISDPSRFDYPFVDTEVRKNPPKNYQKHITKIKHILHEDYGGLFEDVFWSRHKHPNLEHW